MYGQGNYNSQFGRSPPAPMPPPYQPQQQLPGPPPLPPHFQQGRPAAPPVFQSGPPLYQHSHPVPRPAIRQIPPDATPSTSQPYLHPQPPLHARTTLPPMYSVDQQNTLLGAQNVHHLPPSMPPRPPRLLPPPPPPSTMYRTPVHQQLQQPGGVQHLQHLPPPPPPPLSASSSFTSNPFGSFVQSTGRNSHTPSMAPLPPPPPPSDPLPIECSPPPPPTSPLLSSTHQQTASNLSNYNKPYGSQVSTSDCVDNDVTTCEVRLNMPQDVVSLNQKGTNLLLRGTVMLDIPPPPPRPTEGKSDSPLLPSGIDSSIHPNVLEFASRTYSPADSDMEMEDDITQSGNDPEVNHPTDSKNSGCDFIHNDLGVKEQSHKRHTSESEKVAFTASILVEQGDKVVSNHDKLVFERPVSKVCNPVINSADEQSATFLEGKIPSGATAAEQDLNSEKNSSQLMKGGSPFRLLQDYTSDDISENDNELHPEFVSSIKDSSSVAVEATSPHGNTGLNMSLKAEIFYEDLGGEVKDHDRGTTDEHVSDKCDNQTSIAHAESPQDIQRKYALEDASIKGAKSASNSLKVDEFGRLVREGASGSDSDDSRYNGRQGKRDRGRSRSPLDSRRRRRSPLRRKEKRSRSRSWSPRNRRSRSRSPRSRRSRSRSPRSRRSRSRTPRNRRSRSRSPRSRRSRSPSRYAGKFSGDGTRRDRGQLPECFDFRRGRCYRGASCRYLHHDSDKSNGFNHHTSKQQYLEVPAIPKNSNIHEEANHNLQKVSDQQHHEIKILEMKLDQDMTGSSFVARNEMHVYQKREDSIHDASEAGNFDQDSHIIDSHTVKSGSSREAAAQILETCVLPQEERKLHISPTNKSCQEPVESSCLMMVGGFPSYPVCEADTLKSHRDASQDTFPHENPVSKPSHSKLSDPLLQNAELPPRHSDNSSVSDSSPEQTSMTVIAQNMAQPPGEYNLITQNASQSASGERFPSYMLPNQQSHFSLSPVASWTPLAPPPPCVSSQLQQSHLPPRNDFGSEIGPYATELPAPQVGDFQQRAYPPMQELNRSISHVEGFRLKPLPPYSLPGQQYISPGLMREDHLTRPPMLDVSTSSSFPRVDNPHLQTSFSQGLSATKMHTVPGDNLPSVELLKSSSQTHPYMQKQQPPYGLHHPASVGSSSRYPPDLQEVNQSTHPPDFRGPRNSTFYNPYASTFEQPLGSKFSSDVGCVGSRQATSSSNSAKAVGQNIPRSGGDQYDPLLDSIEPPSNLSKKINSIQKWEPSSDSDIMLRHSGSNKPLDVEENNKKKKIGGVALAAALDNEECGETANAEGAVEDGSPSNPISVADMNAGEIEIDQIKSPGKSKKNKESRSMKLFKVALADFVKEVLKPSWRQGNMSKEAFKTIVKKTVDKVCGAMKSHQIPKSRAKIDQYIVSSQRKLTKLVTGYVDKYVKM